MRKILLIVIIVILLAFGIRAVFQGTSIGSIDILSIKQIGEKSEKFDTRIEEVNNLINSSYPNKKNELDEARKKEQTVKEQYFDEINSISNEELEDTLKIKNFDIEKIWAKVGNYAIDAGVNIELTQTKKSTTGARNMHFEVRGTYVAQINFLYLLEDDEELDYRIYNFKLVGEDDEMLVANFSIKEAIITPSLNDKLNGYENEDPTIDDPVFGDAINGRKEPYDSLVINPTEEGKKVTPTPTPTPAQTTKSTTTSTSTSTSTKTTSTTTTTTPTPTPKAN